jgi:hypothetical protein
MRKNTINIDDLIIQNTSLVNENTVLIQKGSSIESFNAPFVICFLRLNTTILNLTFSDSISEINYKTQGHPDN